MQDQDKEQGEFKAAISAGTAAVHGCITIRASPPCMYARVCGGRASPRKLCRVTPLLFRSAAVAHFLLPSPVHCLRVLSGPGKDKSGLGSGQEQPTAASPQRKFLTLAVSSSSSSSSPSACPLSCRVITSRKMMLPVVSLLFLSVEKEAARTDSVRFIRN